MKQRKATINLAWANVFALIFFTFVALISSATWYVLWGTPSFEDFGGSLLKDVNPLGLLCWCLFYSLLALLLTSLFTASHGHVLQSTALGVFVLV